jgi:6,7-dimethyl-8-ribityllumazine synthase
VPGSFELPITAKFLAGSKRVDVIVCIGCLVKGETMHFEYIAQATANAIMQVSLETYVPCIFGVLTVLNKEQAISRSTGTSNEGLSWGLTAVEMALNRLSALGMDKTTKKVSESSAFVNFNASSDKIIPATNVTTKKIKKFGF